MALNFSYLSTVLTPQQLSYNPCNDVIFPSVIRATDRIENALGTYYLYYAPHNAPGGICLAYSDSLEGPWTEYECNPIIARDWQPHYEVSHVSSPHMIWNDEAACYYLYFHGENDTTRIASTKDGIHFDYEGIAVSTEMYDGISEASYARVFPSSLNDNATNYVLLFMGNNNGTRRIYAAWSRDGKTFEPQLAPLISPPPDTEVTQVGGPWYFQRDGRNLVIVHGDKTDERLNDVTTDLYLVDVGPDFNREEHLGICYSRTAFSEGNARVSDPCLFEEDGQTWLFTAIGARLVQEIALSREVV